MATNEISEDINGHYSCTIEGIEPIIDGDKSICYLKLGSCYKLQIRNAHPYMCLCHIRIDGKQLGTFLMNDYTQFILERPLEKALAFHFHKPINSKSNGSKVECIFLPEIGANLIKLDIFDHETKKEYNLEISIDGTSADIFKSLKKTGTLIVWTTDEHDSSIDYVVTVDDSIEIKLLHKRQQISRKLSLIKFNQLKIRLESSEAYFKSLTKICTFQDVHQFAKESNLISTNDTSDKVYFLAPSGRYLGSSEWLKDQIPLMRLLHKNELIPYYPTIGVRLVKTQPSNILKIKVKIMDSDSYDLHISGVSTIIDCKFQVSQLGGPKTLQKGIGWLYCGQVVDDEFTLDYYGIRNKDFIDVIIRDKEKSKMKSIETKDPIAVDKKHFNCIPKEYCSNEERTLIRSRSHKGWTILRGLIRQQFITVDPIETDQRFLVVKQFFIQPPPIDEDVIKNETKK